MRMAGVGLGGCSFPGSLTADCGGGCGGGGAGGAAGPAVQSQHRNPRALAPENTFAALTAHVINLSYEDAIAVELSDLRMLPGRQ